MRRRLSPQSPDAGLLPRPHWPGPSHSRGPWEGMDPLAGPPLVPLTVPATALIHPEPSFIMLLLCWSTFPRFPTSRTKSIPSAQLSRPPMAWSVSAPTTHLHTLPPPGLHLVCCLSPHLLPSILLPLFIPFLNQPPMCLLRVTSSQFFKAQFKPSRKPALIPTAE